MAFKLSDDKTKLEGYEGKDSYVTVPDGVIEICRGAFKDNDIIKTIILPNTIEKIEEKAFEKCKNLEHIEFVSVKQCNGCSFCNCPNLKTSIICEKSLIRVSQSIDGTYVIPDGISEIQEGAFCGCEKITDLVIPTSVTSIKKNAFLSCKKLKKVVLPSSLKELESAFGECTQLQSIVLSDGIERINFEAFYSCYNLTSMSLPDSCVLEKTQIDLASEFFPKLNKPIYNNKYFIALPKTYKGHFEIPEGIITIADGAFSECREITSITIPNSVETIPFCAFQNCCSLEIINGMEHIKNIEERAFEGCTKIISMHLPELVNIENDAYQGCLGLKEVSLNTNIHMYGNPFRNCPNLKMQMYNELLINPHVTTSGKYEIPSTIRKICDGAFENCVELKEIVIPDNVVEIGDRAFSGCVNLHTVILPKELKFISSYLFEGCEKLVDVVLPPSLKEIGYSAFQDCKEISELSMPHWVNKISSRAFKGCKNLRAVLLANFAELELGSSTFEDCSSLEEFIIPFGVTKIEDKTFANCINLEFVIIPNTVDFISNNAFEGCKNLKHVELPLNWAYKWDLVRKELGLPPIPPNHNAYKSSDFGYNDSWNGLGATDDGPMLCTEGNIRPCPYCGHDGTSTYIDGTARCDSCRRWFKYTQSWW